MKKYLIVFLLLFVSSFYNNVIKAAAQIPNEALEGRWDITVNMGSSRAPSWLEVRHSGLRTLIGRFVGDGGSARPISQVFFKDGKLSFHIPPQWDNSDKDLYVEGELKDGKLLGTMTMPSGKTYTWTGVRAPKLWRDKEPVWGNSIVLFNGKNLDGWQALGDNQWIVENGILKSPHSGSNIRTVKTFNDFKLHIEFRYPKESNSGVYLRGRYEVQIIDSKGMEPLSIYLGGIYGFIDPLEMVAKGPGEWQSYDITLVGRLVTVIANGKTIIYKQQIPGITGGALDSNEGEPGPIYMQGDHGPIDFRNIVITPAK
ncbi:MAG: DUF1080 domain-containing protein [Bacteroidota bacterium]|nr:DUF1080 domain-containing protein [Bacteroidota bacterium]